MKGTGNDGFQLDPRSLALGGLLGVLLGAGGGYLVARRVLVGKFDARLDSEVASVKAHYNDHLKSLLESGRSYDGQLGDSGTADARGDESADVATGDADGVDSSQPDLLEGLEPGSELDELEGTDRDDQAPASQLVRGVNRPHIISFQEFGETDAGWQQLTITWYNGDGVLVDDKEQPIRDTNSITGVKPVKSMFGGVSGDPSIMYIRNPRLEVDFEVVWDDGSYVDVILNYGKPP